MVREFDFPFQFGATADIDGRSPQDEAVLLDLKGDTVHDPHRTWISANSSRHPMNIKLSQSRPRFLHHLASHHSPSTRLCLADTMYVYNGFNYVENECCTLVFPAGFALKDPQALCAYWQLIVSLGLSAQSLRPPNSTNIHILRFLCLRRSHS